MNLFVRFERATNTPPFFGEITLFLVAMLVVLALSGCAVGERLVDQLPSVRYCSEVNYQRIEQDVTLFARCTAPFESR
jgi:hypothetical protein